MEVNEMSQIEKSLAYADKRISEIRTRRNELDLLEKDMMAMKDNLLNRLNEIQK
jgi:hypothetical protein